MENAKELIKNRIAVMTDLFKIKSKPDFNINDKYDNNSKWFFTSEEIFNDQNLIYFLENQKVSTRKGAIDSLKNTLLMSAIENNKDPVVIEAILNNLEEPAKRKSYLDYTVKGDVYSASNPHDKNALNYSIKSGKKEIVEILIQYGVTCNKSSLELAAKYNEEIYSLLFKYYHAQQEPPRAPTPKKNKR